MNRTILLLLGSALLAAAGVTHAQITYTTQTSLVPFTDGLTDYATFIDKADTTDGGTCPVLPYTPTPAIVGTGCRVYGNNTNPPVIVEFSSPVSAIRVFPNIDHLDAAYDGYQYTISGSNDGMTYVTLFDATSVTGASPSFTLNGWNGTPPKSVNNVLTPGTGPAGTVGYEADFEFSAAYKFYSFAASTVAVASGNVEPEFSAVAALPESNLACYVWSRFPNERLKLNIKRHSPLTEAQEERTFQHPEQISFSVHGKEVGSCGDNSMVVVDGTVITAAPGTPQVSPFGAAMGLETHAARPGCRSVTFECTTNQVNESATTWRCFSRNDWGVFHGASTLTEVDETKDPRCSIFQDGRGPTGGATAAASNGPFSGMRQRDHDREGGDDE